jgi:cytosine/adenosine deaminase-related metal-dependent hydrolase
MNRLAWGADSITGRDVLRMSTMGGAHVLGRDAELGSLEPGKLADIALWRIDGVEHAGIADPVAALTLAGLPPLTRLFVGGEVVVAEGELVQADEWSIARDAASAARRLQARTR